MGISLNRLWVSTSTFINLNKKNEQCVPKEEATAVPYSKDHYWDYDKKKISEEVAEETTENKIKKKLLNCLLEEIKKVN